MFSLHLSLRNLLESLGFNEPLLATLAQESPQDFFDILNSEAVRTEIGGLPDLLLLHQPELLALRLRLRAAGPRPAQRASILPLVPYVSAAPAYSSTTSSTSASRPLTFSPPVRAWTRPSKFRRTTTSTTTSVYQWEQQLQTYWLQRLGVALAPTVAMPPPVFSNADIEVLELGGVRGAPSKDTSGGWRGIIQASETIHTRSRPNLSSHIYYRWSEPRADRRSSRHSARRCGGYLVVCGSLLRTFHLTSSPDCKSACWSGVGWRRGTLRRRQPCTLSMFGHWRVLRHERVQERFRLAMPGDDV